MTDSPRPHLALVGDRSSTHAAHAQLDLLARHWPVTSSWVPTDQADAAQLVACDGIWLVPGSPYRSQEGALFAARLARETGIPYLGTCGGFQHAILEFARNVLGVSEAEDVQYDADAATAVIVPLSCSFRGQKAPLHIEPGTRLAQAYALTRTEEIFHCQYGVNPDFLDAIVSGGMVVSAWDEQRSPRAVELPEHPFFVATLFQPERSATVERSHPLIDALLGAMRAHRGRGA